MVEDAKKWPRSLLDKCARDFHTKNLSTARGRGSPLGSPLWGAREEIRQNPDKEIEKVRVSFGISDSKLMEGLVTLPFRLMNQPTKPVFKDRTGGTWKNSLL